MSLRPALGDFSSILCFKALITGVEDTLGQEGAAAAFAQAGRLRGRDLATSLHLAGKVLSAVDLRDVLDRALGEDGTRLCRVKEVRMERDSIYVDTAETVCSAGESPSAPRACTFTLGAVWGAVETIQGRSFTARQSQSVLRGGSFDTFCFSPA